ncbi:hypothetical protein BJX76DRAFT_353779 [Aspergillus varians]
MTDRTRNCRFPRVPIPPAAFYPSSKRPLQETHEDEDESQATASRYPRRKRHAIANTLDEVDRLRSSEFEPKSEPDGANRIPAPILGVSHDDLPINPPGTENPSLVSYMALPVLRKLDWRTNPEGEPIRKELRLTEDLVSAFIQTRGELMETPCTACAEGKGPWRSCVVQAGSVLAAGEGKGSRPADRVCANCRRCRRWNCSKRGTRRRERHEAAGGGGECIPTKSSNQRSQLDGLVVRFPLAADAINDHLLLTVAACEMEHHLMVVRARIRQIEERKGREKDVSNPLEWVV